MAKTEDEIMAEELLKEEGQTQVKEDNPPYKKEITREMIRVKPSDVESRPSVKREEREPEELSEYESKTSKEAFESDIHEAEREEGRVKTEQMQMESQNEPSDNEKLILNLEKGVEGLDKRIASETDPEKIENFKKAREGTIKKVSELKEELVKGTKETVKGIGETFDKGYKGYQDYQAKAPERMEKAIKLENQKIEMLKRREELNQLRQKTQGNQGGSGSGFGGSGLGSGGLPFSSDWAGVGLNRKTETNQKMIREKVTTYVKGKPVVTERWVPVKEAAGKKTIPTDQQELYAKELQKAQVYEQYLPFGGQHSVVGQEQNREVPFTGGHNIIGGQQQQPAPFSGTYGRAARQTTRVVQRQQPAPFSGSYGVAPRQPTRVVRRGQRRPAQNQERQVIININQTPFGGNQKKSGTIRKNVQPARKNTVQNMPFGGFGLGKGNNKKGKWF